MTVPKKRGRPCKYTQQIADEICSRLAEGESIRAICRDAHMPSDSIVQEWIKGEGVSGAPFPVQYARARQLGYERMVDEILEISDAPCIGPDGTADNALVQKQRLQTDSRKWLLSKLLPKQFGDKITQELTSDPDAPVITRIELVPVDPVMRAATALPRRRDGGSDGG